MGLLQKTTTLSAPSFEGIKGLPEDFPIPSRRIILEIGDEVYGLFKSISGISIQREVVPYREGGRNNHELEFPGQLSYGHITLKGGLTSTDFFHKWMVEGQYDGYANPKPTVVLKQNRHTPDGLQEEYLTWEFTNVFPVAWSISDLDITDSRSIVVETLELSFDYFTPTMA